jgi:hypothetical protein
MSCAGLPFDAQALDSLRNEIVYRTNLGRADDVGLLLKQGISPNEKNNFGVPLIVLAAARLDKEGLNIIETLLDKGADINARDNNGETALFAAARIGNMDVVNFLLKHNIDYYAKNSNGDIARTIAYNAGHNDVVQTLDNYVLLQTKENMQKYTELNEVIKQRYDAIAHPPVAPEPVKKPAEPAPVVATPPAPVAPLAVVAPPAPAPVKAEEPAAPPVETTAPVKTDTKADIEKSVQQDIAEEEDALLAKDAELLYPELSFNSCAYQYWSYCSSAKQSTELSVNELYAAIDSYKSKVEATSDKLIKEMQVNPKKVSKISTSAIKRMYNELNNMPSNIYRYENGVGHKDDMQSRCREISHSWSVEPPADRPPEDANTLQGKMRRTHASESRGSLNIQ